MAHYLRFGDIPKSGKSKNHLTGESEQGVSVYECVIINGRYKLVMPDLTHSACVSLSGVLERPCYLVSGAFIGRGSDGEPLLRSPVIIKPINIHGEPMKKIPTTE